MGVMVGGMPKNLIMINIYILLQSLISSIYVVVHIHTTKHVHVPKICHYAQLYFSIQKKEKNDYIPTILKLPVVIPAIYRFWPKS